MERAYGRIRGRTIKMDEIIKKIIEDFKDATRRNYYYSHNGEWRKANVAAKQRREIFKTIREKGKEAREALLSLVEEEDSVIALGAAVYSLKYDTKKSLAALKRIAEKGELFLAHSAELSIGNWKNGRWDLE